jgi:hypothetical protein
MADIKDKGIKEIENLWRYYRNRMEEDTGD